MQRVIMRNDSALMPTIPKLFGSVGMALTGFATVIQLAPHLTAEVKTGGLMLMAACFGVLIGWRVLGRESRGTQSQVVAVGFRAAFFLGIWTLLFLGSVQMLEKALRMRYDGPMEAVGDVLAQGLEVGYMVLQLDVIAVLFIGGALSAIATGWAARRWQ